MVFFSSNKGYSTSPGSGSTSVSNYKSQKPQNNSNLYCDYCNRKGHTRAICFRLHGYPANWRGKRRTSPGPTTAANLARVNSTYGSLMEYTNFTGQGSSSGNSSSRPQLNQIPSPPGSIAFNPNSSHALMTNLQPPQYQCPQYQYPQQWQYLYPQPHHQYLQTPHLPAPENDKLTSDCTMRTSGMLSCSHYTVDDKWIVDSGASKHMVNNMNLLTKYTNICDSS